MTAKAQERLKQTFEFIESVEYARTKTKSHGVRIRVYLYILQHLRCFLTVFFFLSDRLYCVVELGIIEKYS